MESQVVPSIFTNMFSFLTPSSHPAPWPCSLELPPLPEIEVTSPAGRPKMINSVCRHLMRKHYAKNLCRNCYHKQGTGSKAWVCGHVGRSHYANGMCKKCYSARYYQIRKVREKSLV
mmetsp:Transcript_23093/g.41240  ORF Transcript_23093/g.41240 Transcript_23093/m.41240 type:complete len:117 (+) Transcript_23093:18-368(+)